MEDQCSPISWEFFEEEEGMEGLWHSLVNKTLELETKVASAKEEIVKKEDELVTLKDFLSQAIKERDEAESKCQSIMTEIFTLQRKQHQNVKEAKLVDQVTAATFDFEFPEKPELPISPAAAEKLPEQGRLLQAVVEAGPLLQTLLLAGPLPRWQHPPPRVDSVEIPPVTISCTPRIRQTFHPLPLPQYYYADSCVFQSDTKRQKVALF